MRERWQLGQGPIADVVGVMERHGVVVARLPAHSDRVDAFSCWIGARPYVVLTSNKQAADRSRFDAAHELAHLLFHPDAVPGAKSQESEAQSFASAFLLPRASVTPELPSRPDFTRLVDMKLRWRVSIQALLRRGHDVGIYSDAAYRRAMTRLSTLGWRKSEPGDAGPPEQPTLLARAADMLRQRLGPAPFDERMRLGTQDQAELLSMVDAQPPRVLAG